MVSDQMVRDALVGFTKASQPLSISADASDRIKAQQNNKIVPVALAQGGKAPSLSVNPPKRQKNVNPVFVQRFWPGAGEAQAMVLRR